VAWAGERHWRETRAQLRTKWERDDQDDADSRVYSGPEVAWSRMSSSSSKGRSSMVVLGIFCFLLAMRAWGGEEATMRSGSTVARGAQVAGRGRHRLGPCDSTGVAQRHPGKLTVRCGRKERRISAELSLPLRLLTDPGSDSHEMNRVHVQTHGACATWRDQIEPVTPVLYSEPGSHVSRSARSHARVLSFALLDPAPVLPCFYSCSPNRLCC